MARAKQWFPKPDVFCQPRCACDPRRRAIFPNRMCSANLGVRELPEAPTTRSRSFQELLGASRSYQGLQELQEVPGAPPRAPKDSRDPQDSQEAPGASRSSQKRPRAVRSSRSHQELPGASRSRQEPSGAPRRPQKLRPQELQELPGVFRSSDVPRAPVVPLELWSAWASSISSPRRRNQPAPLRGPPGSLARSIYIYIYVHIHIFS